MDTGLGESMRSVVCSLGVVLLGSCLLLLQPVQLQRQSGVEAGQDGVKGEDQLTGGGQEEERQSGHQEWLNSLNTYDVVIPKRLRSKNSDQYYTKHFLNKDGSSDSSRSSNIKESSHDDINETSLYYTFTAFNKQLHLHLTPNSDFIAPNLIIERKGVDKNDTWIRSDWEKNQHCFHSGIVHGDKDSIVTLSLCESMMGSIFVDNTLYLIQPHPNVTNKKEDDVYDIPHVIYKTEHSPDYYNNIKTDTSSSSSTSHCGMSSDIKGEDITSPYSEHSNVNSHKKRHKRASAVYQGNSEHFVELMIVADDKMAEFHGSDLEHYLFVLLSIVSSIYKKHTIQNNINVMVMKVVVLDYNGAGPRISTNAATTLHNFCQWQRTQNAQDDTDPTHHDTAVLITRTDICRSPMKCDTLGLAELGTICDPVRSCAIAEDNGLSAAFTIAHELGHVFSLPHDDDYRCRRYTQGSREYSLMAPTLDYTTNPWSWSVCSAAELTEFLDSGHGKCLQDKPRRLQYLEQIQSSSVIQPGEIYTVDEQCKQAFGKPSKICPYSVDSYNDGGRCSRLWCTSVGPYGEDRGCRTQHMPWADGTKCGPSMWCKEGRCIQRNSLSPIHGGWSSWQEYGECSRSCGGGIRKGIRHCSNPAPRHGGRFCVGERVRYESCRSEPCPGVDNFRDHQCAKHNGNNFNIVSVGDDVRWIPKYTGIAPNDKCKLFCQAEGNSAIYYRLEAKVKDGTKCDPYTSDVCINGKCKPAGCDNIIGSARKMDQCGVCDGDGRSCRTVTKRYSPPTQTFGYNQVAVISKGSSNIRITQTGYSHRKNDDNFLALKNSNGDYILNGEYVVSMSKKEVRVKGSVLEYSGSDNVVEVIKGTHKIHEDVYLMVLAVGKLHPPNITYTYTVSEKESSPADEPRGRKTEKRRRNRSKYKWTRRYRRCITPCGEGRKKTVWCVRFPGKHIVADQYCEMLRKPKPPDTGCFISHSKRKSKCETIWRVISQSSCSARCGEGQGTVRREYKCFRTWPQTYRRTEIVDDKFCLVQHKKPKNKFPCTGICVEPEWKYGEWSKCTRTCDGGVQHRNSVCVDRYDDRIPESQCSSQLRKNTQGCNKETCPSWVSEQWAQCSVRCGMGEKRRHVWCKHEGKPANNQMCDSSDEPQGRAACDMGPCSSATWDASPWRDCSVTCGTGVRIRKVTCKSNQNQVVDNSNCNRNNKPHDIQACYLSRCEDSRYTTRRTTYPNNPWRQRTTPGTTSRRHRGNAVPTRNTSQRPNTRGPTSPRPSTRNFDTRRPGTRRSSTFRPTRRPGTNRPTTRRPTRRPGTHRPTHWPGRYRTTRRPTHSPGTTRQPTRRPTHRPTQYPGTRRTTYRPTRHPNSHRTFRPTHRTGTYRPTTNRPTHWPNRPTTPFRPTGRPTNFRHTTESIPIGIWRTGSWTACSVTCGRGMHARYVSCRERNGNMVHESACDNIPKPPAQEHCIDNYCVN